MKRLNIKKYLLTFFILIFLMPSALTAQDFGITLNINAGYGNPGTDESKFDFSAALWPRLSGLIGNNSDYILTAGLTLGADDNFYIVPEIMHTELTLRFGSSGLRIGRFNYSDPLVLIANGLFDGFQFFHNSHAGIIRIGAWYTGFLYKNNANIAMTEDDVINSGGTLDYNDFLNTYFAPSRAFASIEWEHLSLGEIMQMRVSLIGQFDLTAAESKYNNQYVVLKAGLPINNFLIELGGSLELSQTIADETQFNLSLAGELGLSILFPSELNSRISFKGIIAGGHIDDTISAFVPISTIYYGYIFKQKMAGLSVISFNYSARLHQTLGLSVNALYFVRNDLGTMQGYPAAEESGGYFLGQEFAINLVWSPFSDLQLNVRGGIFIPALGDAGPDENLSWRFDLTAVFALY